MERYLLILSAIMALDSKKIVIISSIGHGNRASEFVFYETMTEAMRRGLSSRKRLFFPRQQELL